MYPRLLNYTFGLEYSLENTFGYCSRFVLCILAVHEEYNIRRRISRMQY